MSISLQVLEQAIDAIARVPGVAMDPDNLVEDVVLLASVWEDAEEFDYAVASTVRALRLLAGDRVDTSDLAHDLAGYDSFHYQHRRSRGQKADMRIVFRGEGGIIVVLGFGHRRLPSDVYRRLAATR